MGGTPRQINLVGRQFFSFRRISVMATEDVIMKWVPIIFLVAIVIALIIIQYIVCLDTSSFSFFESILVPGIKVIG